VRQEVYLFITICMVSPKLLSFILTGSGSFELLSSYELNEWLQEARSKGINDPRDVWRYARQKETALHGA
jgi:hypothetical protein